MVKRYSVTFILRQLSASHYHHNTTVVAPSIGRAVDLAWKVVKTRPAVKGKRLSSASIEVSEIIENNS